MANAWLTYAGSLPGKPGVYLYHGPDDEVIYVGKAINLRNRVRSYFQASADLSPSKRLMIEEIKRIDHIIVRSETEALLLESTLIKKYRPKYNVVLKDDKYFQYIKIALAQDFPQVSTVRRVVLDGSRYFGPYTSGFAVRQTLRLLKRLFPYKSCSNAPEVPCFDYQLGRCLGHSVMPDSQTIYQNIIARLMDFLDGKTGDVLKNLKRDMATAAADRDFEEAARLRDRLQALQHVLEQQTVVTSVRGNFDVVSLAREGKIAAANLFQIRRGKLVQRDTFTLQHVQESTDAELVAAFVQQYYSQATQHPPEVIVPMAIPETVGQSLQIKMHHVARGLKRKLMLMGQENAQDHLRREQLQHQTEEQRAKQALTELAAALNLPSLPHRMEMYDISNNQGRFPVGSMVVFIDGVPHKAAYKKFAIKTVTGPDDVHMMAEVLRRRFQRKGERGWPLPDLLLLDGGKPQLNTVMALVGEIPRDMPIAALAKREEELFVPERSTSIRLPAGSQGLFLIQRIRDEAHRFAISYYRQRHRKATTASLFDEIDGVGPKIKKKLFDRFGTTQGIRAASDEDLIDTVGEALAAKIREQL